MYLIDTANLEEIKRVCDYYPIQGVTTNPTIIAREKTDFFELITSIREFIGMDAMLHVQIISPKAEDMLEEAKKLIERIGGNIYIKVPANAEGIKGIKLLTKNNIKTTATAICSTQQAMMAAYAGAAFVAPYVNRSDDANNNGVAMVEKIAILFKMNGLDTKILAASFNNVRQVQEVMLSGATAITISGELMDKLVTNALAEWSIDKFNNDWASVYGEGVTTLDFD